jgi:hypothetical protein
MTVTGPLGPASWLNNSILAFNSGNPLVINFSQPVSNVSIQFGDFDQDNDTETMTAFSGPNGTGANLGSSTVFYPSNRDISNGDSAVATLGVNANGISSVVITSPFDATNNPFPFSIYFDNLAIGAAATVPEPSTLALLAAGSLALMGYRLRRRRKVD